MANLEPAQTLLIPTCEYPPGALTQMRNQVKDALVKIASAELKLQPKDLVVRDIRWVEDLVAYSTGTTPATVNNWTFTTEGAGTAGYYTITGTRTMTTSRYVALYGAKDLRWTYGTQQAAATTMTLLPQCISLIKLDVGGGTRAIWDLSKVEGIGDGEMAGVSSSAVIIPQDASYNIWYYKCIAVASTVARVVLDGIVVEPRGLVCAP